LNRALAALEEERARLEEAIIQAGNRRYDHIAKSRMELERIGDLAIDAIEAGSSPGDLADKAGISKRTLYKLLDERGYEGHRR
jgi:predicted AAA+ superfamily ATPase